jgi:hypothetical protein
MWKRWRLPKPDLNDGLALVGIPVALFALWQLHPRAFWAGLALLGALAAAWGLYRARAR